MIEIDGTYGEGGGSIIRLAIAFSAITKKPVHIINIRKNRKKPGLREQHLKSLLTVANLCNAKVEGASLGSTEVTFFPENLTKRSVQIDVNTSGSIGLIMQCVLLPCFFSKNEVMVEIVGGGTVGLHAPHIYYTKYVFLEMIKKLGFHAEIEIRKQGFYPKGGADIILKTNPLEKTSNIKLKERGKMLSLRGVVLASKNLQKSRVAERMRKAAADMLLQATKIYSEITIEYCETLSDGASIILWATFEHTIMGWDEIGERGVLAEEIGKKAAEKLIKQLESPATVDDYMSDQLLPYLAICNGSFISYHLTQHAETNVWLIKKIFGKKIQIKKETARTIFFM